MVKIAAGKESVEGINECMNIGCIFHSNLLRVSLCKIGLDCVRCALRAFLKPKFLWGRPPPPPPPVQEGTHLHPPLRLRRSASHHHYAQVLRCCPAWGLPEVRWHVAVRWSQVDWVPTSLLRQISSYSGGPLGIGVFFTTITTFTATVDLCETWGKQPSAYQPNQPGSVTHQIEIISLPPIGQSNRIVSYSLVEMFTAKFTQLQAHKRTKNGNHSPTTPGKQAANQSADVN